MLRSLQQFRPVKHVQCCAARCAVLQLVVQSAGHAMNFQQAAACVQSWRPRCSSPFVSCQPCLHSSN